MKYLFFLISLIFLFTCSEECQTCTVIVEDNVAAVELLCQGFEVDLDFYETQTEETNNYCGDDLEAVMELEQVNETLDI